MACGLVNERTLPFQRTLEISNTSPSSESTPVTDTDASLRSNVNRRGAIGTRIEPRTSRKAVDFVVSLPLAHRGPPPPNGHGAQLSGLPGRPANGAWLPIMPKPCAARWTPVSCSALLGGGPAPSRRFNGQQPLDLPKDSLR